MNSAKHYLTYLGYILFFMMLFVPTTYQPVKAVLLGVILLAVISSSIWRGRLHVSKSIGLWTLFTVTTGMSFICLGVINSAPGALRVGTVYLLWPLIYTVLLAGIDSKVVVNGLFNVLVVALIAISLYSMLFLLHAIGWIPDALYFELDMGQGAGFYDGYVEYRLYNISTLLFLVPFILSILLTTSKSFILSRLWLWLAFFLGLSVAILSGRRAVWLIIIISPFIILFFRMMMNQQYKRQSSRQFNRTLRRGSVFIVLMFFVGINWVGLDFTAIQSIFLEGFNFSSDSASESARRHQFFELLREWQKNPLLGAGHGAAAEGSIRSAETPWAYELSYMALLFHTGLIGIICYGAAIFWVFWMGVKIIRSSHWLNQYMLPVLVGTSSFLIANATNPYLAKYDYIWVIFLPVALINIWLLDSQRGKVCRH